MNLHIKLYFKYIEQVPNFPANLKSKSTLYNFSKDPNIRITYPFILYITWVSIEEFNKHKYVMKNSNIIQVLVKDVWVTVDYNFNPIY